MTKIVTRCLVVLLLLSSLNDIRGRHVGQAEVFAALRSAKGGPVEEGSVGAGTGTVAFGFKFLSEFNPATFEELLTTWTGERNAWIRMVLGYWDMAASLVTFGTIDAAMFGAANSEMVATFAKVEPFLADIRRVSGIPEFLEHVEAVVREMPGSGERLALLREQLRHAAQTQKASTAGS